MWGVGAAFAEQFWSFHRLHIAIPVCVPNSYRIWRFSYMFNVNKLTEFSFQIWMPKYK